MTEHDHPDRAHDDMADAGSPGPPHDGPAAGMPRWVKGFAIAGGILVLLIVVMLMTGGHGPGRHTQGLGQTPAIGQSQSITVANALRP